MPLMIGEPDSPAARAFMAAAERLAAQVSIASYNAADDSADRGQVSVRIRSVLGDRALTQWRLACRCWPCCSLRAGAGAGSAMPLNGRSSIRTSRSRPRSPRQDGRRQGRMRGDIATAATRSAAPALTIDTAAVQLASATDLEDARAKFGTLSEAIDTLHERPAPEGARRRQVAYCPMVKKPWLQRDGTHRESVLRQGHADLRRASRSEHPFHASTRSPTASTCSCTRITRARSSR